MICGLTTKRHERREDVLFLFWFAADGPKNMEATWHRQIQLMRDRLGMALATIVDLKDYEMKKVR